ncbi:MAG TPA: DNA-processing protein DprA [Actinomycetota bacterium]|nr:DNA-processing protein DprA [Actinomycetota bacterium]
MKTRYVNRLSEEWPSDLDRLPGEKPVTSLFVSGQPLSQLGPMVAIVGARHPSAAGIDAAENFARGIAQAGFTIVSGVAVGIDAVAHRAALSVGGKSVGVVGCGLDIDYPQRNRRLKSELITHGALISEYPAGTEPRSFHFPERNRIIAGLSKAVVFVEGGERSGGRITARIAADTNREVFAVPGSFRNPLAAGPNELIRTGQAALATDVNHVLEVIAPQLVWRSHLDDVAQQVEDPTLGLLEEDRRILEFLDDIPVSPDLLCARLEIPATAAGLALSRLEVRGLVVRKAGGYLISKKGAELRVLLVMVAEKQGSRS